MDQKRAIAALGALAQETRLELFRLLVATGPQGLPAGVIADRLGVLLAVLPPRAADECRADHPAPAQPAVDLFRRIRCDDRPLGLPHRELLRPRAILRPGLRPR